MHPTVIVEDDSWRWPLYTLLTDDGRYTDIPGITLVYGSWYGYTDLCLMAYHYKDGNGTHISISNIQLKGGQ